MYERNENTKIRKYCCYLSCFVILVLPFYFYFPDSILPSIYVCVCVQKHQETIFPCNFPLAALQAKIQITLEIRICTTYYECYFHGSKTINYIFLQTIAHPLNCLFLFRFHTFTHTYIYIWTPFWSFQFNLLFFCRWWKVCYSLFFAYR